MRQNTHKGMFNSSCISNDVECELFMSDIEFTVNLSFIIKIWFFLYACLLRACLSGWYHTHTNTSHFQRELSFIVTLTCFAFACYVWNLYYYIYIYIYKRDRGEENTYKKEYAYHLSMLPAIIQFVNVLYTCIIINKSER